MSLDKVEAEEHAKIEAARAAREKREKSRPPCFDGTFWHHEWMPVNLAGATLFNMSVRCRVCGATKNLNGDPIVVPTEDLDPNPPIATNELF